MTQSSRKLKRIERKRKKLTALYEVAKLNDNDRQSRIQKDLQKQVEIDPSLKMASSVALPSSENIQRKRLIPLSPSDSKNAPKESTDAKPNNLTEVKKPRLTEEELEKMKTELRERKKKSKAFPRLNLKQVGENAKFNHDSNGERVPIFFSDVQHLLLYSVLGNHSPYTPTRWCSLEKFHKLTQTMVLVVEGLSSHHYLSYRSMFPNITNLLQHQLELMTPAVFGGSIIEELAVVSLTGTQYDKIIKEFGSLEYALQHSDNLVKRLKLVFPLTTPKQPDGEDNGELLILPNTDKFSRTQLLLAPSQMVEENYPMPLQGILSRKYKHYVLTKDEYMEAGPTSPMFALDCEMCKTTTGMLELTRISLVNEQMERVYDTLVMPDNEITDYLTKWSGITPEILKDVTTKLEDVQKHLREILPSDAILVGQSLNADLHALQMMHPYIIDTSVIYNLTGNRYVKSKLKMLSQKFLKEEIQNSDEGHCSLEDSIACMKLVQLKLKHSIDFGDGVLNERHRIETSFLYKKPKFGFKDHNEMALFKQLSSSDNTVAIIGSNQVVDEYSKILQSSKLCVPDSEDSDLKNNVRLEIRDNNKSVIKRTEEISINHQFNLCHVRIEEDRLAEEKREKTFRAVDKYVRKIWESSTPMSMVCVVFSGQANSATGACFLNVKKIGTKIFNESNDYSSESSDA